ncbi:MAG: aminoacyl-tRNA hydrolase [Clostridiales bacterium]|nr:aminoacyl-tRNA hydrolase [Clostridia bacterium]MCR5353129.1 aminoacyl-tRNA hydrolase [Clostridiales bacterium]
MDRLFALFKKIESNKDAESKISFVIAGLGNYGEKYRNTRHNAGFLALSYMAQKLGAQINRSKFKSLCADCMLGDKRVLLLLPQTYMNNSGEAVREALSYYKLTTENLLVIYDDVSLPLGKIRVRTKGSDGGHNGIKSIIYQTGSDVFPRIKIGIGENPRPEDDLADWVLSYFTKEEQQTLFDRFEDVLGASRLIVSGNAYEAMNKYNG